MTFTPPKASGSHKLGDRLSPAFFVLCALLLLAFAIGGTARSDAYSTIFLRPASFLALAYGLLTLRADQVRAHRFLFIMAGCITLLPLLHLVPLPPALWQSLPGRDLVIRIDEAAGLGDIWRPLTLDPAGSRAAFYALGVPLAVLVLGVQLSPQEQRKLLPFILCMGLVSILIGLMQIAGAQGLYLYSRTTLGAPVGLFANRNHEASFIACMIAMIPVFVVDRYLHRRRTQGHRRTHRKQRAGLFFWLGAEAVLMLMLFLLVLGSRQGLAVAGVAILLTPLVAVRFREVSGVRIGMAHMAAAAILLAAVVGVSAYMSRDKALDRALDTAEQPQDWRFDAIGPVTGMIGKYFPTGAGMGSYVTAFQVDEPYNLLDPTYSNNAHNDWLEPVMDGGLPAIALMAAAAAAYVLRLRRTVRRSRELAASGILRENDYYRRLGLLVILLLALASLVDYPLRVPSLAALFVIAVCWSCMSGKGDVPRDEQQGERA